VTSADWLVVAEVSSDFAESGLSSIKTVGGLVGVVDGADVVVGRLVWERVDGLLLGAVVRRNDVGAGLGQSVPLAVTTAASSSPPNVRVQSTHAKPKRVC